MPSATLCTTSPETDHRYRTDQAAFEIPADFRRRVAPDAAFTPLLNRYHASRSIADRDAIIDQLLPMVMKLAQWRRNRTRFKDELDELVSDGCTALPGLIERYSAMPADRFLSQCYAGIRWAFVNGACERGRWRKQVLSPKQKLLRAFRQRFTKEHGRTPDSNEVQGYVATLITNPNMDVKPAIKKHVPFSVLQNNSPDNRTRQYADPNASTVAPLIDAETVEFALKGFTGVDRQIFQLSVLDGVCNQDIARQLKINKKSIAHRVNAVLWQARCRCDLARALGVEPSPEPLRFGKGNYVSVAKQPPARMVG